MLNSFECEIYSAIALFSYFAIGYLIVDLVQFSVCSFLGKLIFHYGNFHNLLLQRLYYFLKYLEFLHALAHLALRLCELLIHHFDARFIVVYHIFEDTAGF